jgi:phosphatidylglycerophosphate synthase
VQEDVMTSRKAPLKAIADILTFTRLIIGILIIVVALTQGREGLSLALLLLLLGWGTDTLDGQLARRVPDRQNTWIGDNDIVVDVLLSFAIMFFFTLGGYIPVLLAVFCLIYLIAVIFVFSGWTLYAIFVGISYGSVLIVSLLHSPKFFLVFLLYIAIMLITTWTHCWENIMSFFTGFKSIEARQSQKKNSP